MTFTFFSVTDTDPPLMPSDVGYLAWNFEPDLTSGNQAPTSGQIYYMKIKVRQPVLATGVACSISTGGVTLTAGANWMGLLDSNGNRVGLTADMTTQFASIQRLKAPFAGGPISLTPQDYFGAILSNGTTPPQLQRASAQSVSVNSETVAPFRYSLGAAAQTVLPASASPSAYTASAFAFWMGIY